MEGLEIRESHDPVVEQLLLLDEPDGGGALDGLVGAGPHLGFVVDRLQQIEIGSLGEGLRDIGEAAGL